MHTPESLLLLKLAKAVKQLKARQPEKGDPGRDPTAQEISTAVSLWMEFHREELKGEPGKTPKAIPGPPGVGIQDIDVIGDQLVITLTDGQEKRFKLPEREDTRYRSLFLGAAGTGSSEQPQIGELRLFRFPPSSTYWLPVGATYNYDDYPRLGELYGASPGGTFTVENFKGRALYVADDDNEAGELSGTDQLDLTHGHAAGSLQTASAGQHNHTGKTGSTGSVTVGPPQLLGNINVTPANVMPTISNDGSHTHAISGNTASSLTQIDKRPARGYVLLYIRAA